MTKKKRKLPAQKKSSPKRKSAPKQKAAPPAPRPPLQTQFSRTQLRAQFRKLFTQSLLQVWLGAAAGSFYQRLFTPLITLWYLVFQRLSKDHSLEGVVSDARLGGADALSPPGKPLSAGFKSDATTTFNDARQRLPLTALQQALAYSAQQVRSWVQNSAWQGWNVILLDGSTVRLRSVGDIPQFFRPHRNSHGPTYWCLMRVVVGFCLTTGVAVATAMGASSVSEQTLALPLLAELARKSLVVADRNFGIFFVAQAAVSAQAQALIRLTKMRACKLARSNGLRLCPLLDQAVNWTASRHDQTHPGGPQTLAGRLLVLPIQRRGYRPQIIYLFTTLQDAEAYTAQALLDLYGQRWQVELYLRYVKTQMELGVLTCKSAEMARKEWVAGLLAYNLIRSLMVAAATQAKVSVGELSFSRVRKLLLSWTQRHGWQTRGAARQWSLLLRLAGKCRHPKRRKPRPAEPRAIRHFKQNFPALKGDRAAARKKWNPKS